LALPTPRSTTMCRWLQRLGVIQPTADLDIYCRSGHSLMGRGTTPSSASAVVEGIFRTENGNPDSLHP
jgi:hypothetical protein